MSRVKKRTKIYKMKVYFGKFFSLSEGYYRDGKHLKEDNPGYTNCRVIRCKTLWVFEDSETQE